MIRAYQDQDWRASAEALELGVAALLGIGGEKHERPAGCLCVSCFGPWDQPWEADRVLVPTTHQAL